MTDEAGGVPAAQPSLRVIHEREWESLDGTRWQMRGDELTYRSALRLLQRPGRRVLHVYGPHARVVSGDDEGALVDRLTAFFADEVDPHTTFRVADFRTVDRQVLVVVEESC